MSTLDRLISYIAEQTGLAREIVDKVLDAQLRFYTDHPGNIDATKDELRQE